MRGVDFPRALAVALGRAGQGGDQGVPAVVPGQAREGAAVAVVGGDQGASVAGEGGAGKRDRAEERGHRLRTALGGLDAPARALGRHAPAPVARARAALG